MFRAPAAPLVHRSKTTAEPWRKWCHFLRYGPNHDVLVLIGRGILTDAFRNGFACCVLIGRATDPRRGAVARPMRTQQAMPFATASLAVSSLVAPLLRGADRFLRGLSIIRQKTHRWIF